MLRIKYALADPDIKFKGGGGGGDGAWNEPDCQENSREFWRAKINI